MKNKIFKSVLGLYGFMAFTILGVVHIFMPDAYFAAIDYPLWDPADPVQREMVELIGGGYVAQGVGAALVLLRPARNVDLFRMLLLAGSIGVAVVIYTILIGVAPQVVWFNTVIPYTVMLAIMAFCFPWNEARQYGARGV